MHEFMNDNCEKCSKFSYCNNNDLICVSRYRAKKHEIEDLQGKCHQQESMIAYFQETEGKYSEYVYKQMLNDILKICHRKTDGLYSKTNPLKDILQIIENEPSIDK